MNQVNFRKNDRLYDYNNHKFCGVVKKVINGSIYIKWRNNKKLLEHSFDFISQNYYTYV